MNYEHSSHDSSWTMIDIDVSCDESEIVAEYLWSHGVAGVEVISASDGKRETLRTNVGENPETFLASLQTTFSNIGVSVAQVKKTISETWREFVTPTWVSDTLVIVPEWIDAPDAPHVLRIEPRDTFGLGNHPTTVLAMRLAMSHVAPGARVFDLGTGSGVLAIGLAKFLECDCVCSDIAPASKDAVSINMNLNSVTSVSWIERYPTEKVDAVLANILAPVLIEESASIQNCLKDGGVVVLSGMREEQCASVVSQYTECFEIARETLEGWCAVVLRKTSDTQL